MSAHHVPDVTMESDRGPGLPLSEPVVFSTFTGLFQAAPGGLGDPVLMLSPFGYEELCGRTAWTTLADRLAAAGIASLRFDFPGTANALDADPAGLEDWRSAALEAAAALRSRTGRTRIALLGQGLGATLAAHWARDLGASSALVLLAPATSGRAYLRGLKAWGASMAAAARFDPGPSPHGVAGFDLPAERAAAIQALDLRTVDTPRVPILLLEPPGGSAGGALLNRPGAEAAVLDRRDFPGHADLLTDPTSARVPTEALATVVEWLSSRAPDPCGHEPRPAAPLRRAPAGDVLRGPDFDERPVRFGRGLAGVFCIPRQAEPCRSAVILVGAGRDYSIGWGRSAVAQARALARQGVASLRFDIAGIGDSRAAPAMPDEVLYSTRMCADLRAAVDHVAASGYAAIGLAGRCSGAWAAFTVAADDPRVSRLALVNTGYFLWDASKTFAEVVRFSQRDIGDLGATLLRRDGLRRLLKGQLDLGGARRFLVRQAKRHVLRRHARLLGRLTAESRRYHDLHARFAVLRARGVGVLLAYAEGDKSLDEVRSLMGPGLGRLEDYPGMTVRIMPGADHNFTSPPAGAALLSQVVDFFGARDFRLDLPGTVPEPAPRRGRGAYHLVPGGA